MKMWDDGWHVMQRESSVVSIDPEVVALGVGTTAESKPLAQAPRYHWLTQPPARSMPHSTVGTVPMKTALGISFLLFVAPLAQGADIEAGKAKVAAVCAACHGAQGV